MPFRKKHFFLYLSIFVLFACAVSGCRASAGDQTEEANKLVDEMNAIKQKAAALTQQANAKGDELEQKDVEKEGEQIKALAVDQVSLYKQAAATYREAADKAEAASKLKTDAWFKDYLALNARHLRKIAEVLDVGREEAEAWVNEKALDDIADKRAQTEERAAKLSKEVDELSQQIQKSEEEHKDDIRK
jgi:uncharacterized protein YlxW (UPF0749 family)